MRARLLQNTSAHPFGQGTIIEVAEEDVLRYPRIYQAVEAEELASATIDRIREAQIANAARDFQVQKNALAREDPLCRVGRQNNYGIHPSRIARYLRGLC